MTIPRGTGTASTASAAPIARTVRLRPHSLAPRAARRIVREEATGALTGRLVDRCALVAGELVADAIRRTSRAVDFIVETEGCYAAGPRPSAA